jgi:hypothetical protein
VQGLIEDIINRGAQATPQCQANTNREVQQLGTIIVHNSFTLDASSNKTLKA